MSSAICLNLGQSKILLSGNGLTVELLYFPNLLKLLQKIIGKKNKKCKILTASSGNTCYEIFPKGPLQHID